MTVRIAFETALQALQDDVLMLGDRVERALAAAVEALKNRDFEASHAVIAEDRHTDALRYKIEGDALMLIATQQPMASDMRTIAAALIIANELERIGDYAKGIARINLKIGDQPLLKPLIDIPRMAEIARWMVHRSLEAFVRRSLDIAYEVIAKDEEVDALYDQVYSEVLTKLFADVSKLEQGNLLVMAAHHLERAADRATNICERVIYCVTGKLMDTGNEDDFA
jgi:phosphate transport system protein